ncbi:MAG: AAA family ATPase [Planctomycetia bacterium]|nr:AAA family ATPase [Planctomycetia bacterium]
MRIKNIRIDGFGVWRDLELGELSGQATVFHGPNEAGKTTLMQFIRSILYGFSPARKQRYLPPLGGGRPGGSLAVDTAQGRCEIARWNERGNSAVVTSPDGTQQGEPALAALLGGIDEAIFNNVYACGLREIQELGTLTDTDAAKHLYDLTTGLDRVSLVDVQRELHASRDRLLAADGRPSVISRLLAEQARITAELDTARTGMARYMRLSGERTTLAADVSAAEQQHRTAEIELRLLDVATAIRPKWLERIDVAAQLEAMPPVGQVPTGAVERLQRLQRRINALKRREITEEQRKRALREEADALSINEPLWRQSPRIEALHEQRDWIASIAQQAVNAEAAAAQLETQITALRGQLGYSAPQGAPFGLIGVSQRPPKFKSLRRAAQSLANAKKRRKEAQHAIDKVGADARAAEKELAAGLAKLGETDLTVALEKHGTLTGQLRRRIQLDERLIQMDRNQKELTEQTHVSLDKQLLPTNVLIGLGAAFIVGTLLILVGLLMPTTIVGTLGWPLAILGLLGAAGGAGGKYLMQRHAARELENCHNQLDLLKSQIKQAQEEKDELDRRLPRGGGPLAVRLKTAEANLAALEELQPLDAKKQLTQRETQSSRTRTEEVLQQYRAARRGWRNALRSVGLPETLSPQQARQISNAGNQLTDLETRCQQQRDLAAQSRRELAGCTQRATQLAVDAGMDPSGWDAPTIVNRLATALAEQQTLVRRRDELLDTARAMRLDSRRRAKKIVALRRRRRRWLRAAGASNTADFRRLALAHARRDVLVRQHATLVAEIAAASTGLSLVDGGIADWEDQLARRLADPNSENLERGRQQIASRVSATSTRLQQLYTDRGRLDEQIAALATDRGPAELTLELSMVQQQLRQAVSQWQGQAVCGLLLDDIRTHYERERQPATLQDASEHLNRLTSGTYPRVWTPLGERKLLVDDAQGRALSPEVLSEGTREQLFLSLRLALVARYAERGVRLPLVLDDVLVNFDADRAKSAVHVLRDFAKSGHQVLLFTCHDHIVKAFKAAKVETRAMPARSAGTEVIRAVPELPVHELPMEEEVEAATPPAIVPPVVIPPVVEKKPAAPMVAKPVVMPPLVAPPVVEAAPKPIEKPIEKPVKPRRPAKIKIESNQPAEADDEAAESKTVTRTRWRRKPLDEFARIEFGHVSPPLEDEEMEVVVEKVEVAPKPAKVVAGSGTEPQSIHHAPRDASLTRSVRNTIEDDEDDEDLYGIIPADPSDVLEEEEEDVFESANEELRQLYRMADHEFGVTPPDSEDSSAGEAEDEEYAELDEEMEIDEEANYDEYGADFEDESEAA